VDIKLILRGSPGRALAPETSGVEEAMFIVVDRSGVCNAEREAD
jgi:hypothetical protein